MYINTQLAEFSPNSIRAPGKQIAIRASHQANLGRSHHAAWGAFQTGMQFLQQYAGRSPGNSENIAISNLQLLHRSLLKDPSYAQSLKKASNKIAKNSFSSSHCLYAGKGLCADLLTLKSGTSIQLKCNQDNYAMYLSISGKPSIKSVDYKALISKYWWNRYRQPSHGKLLKNGDVILISPQTQTKKLLAAEKSGCIILRVQLLKNEGEYHS